MGTHVYWDLFVPSNYRLRRVACGFAGSELVSHLAPTALPVTIVTQACNAPLALPTKVSFRLKLLRISESACSTETVFSGAVQTLTHHMSPRPVLPAGAAAGGLLRAEVQRRAPAHRGP